MGDNSGLFVDPEEDEVFFYEVTDREIQLKCSLGDKLFDFSRDENCDNCSDQNDYTSGPGEDNLEDSNAENATGLENISNLTLSSIYSSLPPTSPGRDSGQGSPIPDNRIIPCDDKKQIEQTNLSENKKDENLEISCNKINIHVDHNYSTPVKSIIDKSILKTPKSIVKADKDGGFLKVLSEIALVKAEADENTLKEAQKLPDLSCKEEKTNDDDKENQQSECETNNCVMKLIELTPIKLQDPADKVFNCESFKKKFFNTTPLKLNEDSGNLLDLSICEKEPATEIEKEDLDDGTISSNDVVSESNTSCISDDLCQIKSLSIKDENMDDSDEVKVLFEKLHHTSADDEVKPVLESDTKLPTHTYELIQFDDTITEPLNENQEMNEKEISVSSNDCEADTVQQIPEVKIEVIEEKKMPLRNGGGDCLADCEISQKELQRRYVRRNTMRLLEELNDIVNSEQAKAESYGFHRNSILSKEAAKVIEELKTVGLDDSICSPDQYFDLDNLNTSILGSEFSGILNETLSRPINTLTNKDIELLLEKITSSSTESNLECPAVIQPEIPAVDPLEIEKENICQPEVDNFSEEMPRTPHRFVYSQHVRKTPSTVKEKTPKFGMSVQCKTEKLVEDRSENKIVTKRVLQQPQIIQNRFKGSRSVEKSVRPNVNTRIPKLASASKIPVNSREMKQNGKPTINRTPLLKAQKNLKFSNIESPVQAYINSKTPVLLSNVKAKSESAFNVWMKHGTSSSKPAKPEVKSKLPTSEVKPVLPFVKYRSAIPLKLDKSPESRLPRLAPKLQKLIGSNSPVIAKHEGRIHVSAPRRPQISMNDTSILVNPNEVSVVVRKVAQKGMKQ